MTTKPTTVMTMDEWQRRLTDAGQAADAAISLLAGMTSGPGQSVLALMLAARALCAAYPALPDFAWYFRRVSELRSREPPEREPPS